MMNRKTIAIVAHDNRKIEDDYEPVVKDCKGYMDRDLELV